LVSRIRAALGPAVLVGGSIGYRLGDTLRVDLHHATSLLSQAEARLNGAEAAPALSSAGRALKLLTTDTMVLPDYPDARWAEPARIRHAALLRRTRHAVAAAALRTGDTSTAAIAAEAATRTDPLDEAACRILMQAHDQAGEPARAMAAYLQLRTVLAQRLGVDPAPATHQLYINILQHNAVSAQQASRRTTTSHHRRTPWAFQMIAHAEHKHRPHASASGER
jgi:DNA-binding SARP family transcriptional activator